MRHPGSYCNYRMGTRFSRRTFFKVSGAALASAAWPHGRGLTQGPAWPEGPGLRLGRVVWPWGVNVLSRPNPEGVIRRQIYPDEVVVIVRDVVGRGMAYHNHVWHEVEDGFVYAPYLQPVKNVPQVPLTSLPPEGVWAEVYAPYVDGRSAPLADAPVTYRLYFSAVYKITDVTRGPDDTPWYRVSTETAIHMYAPARAFRAISPDEITPIAPEVADKRLVVNLPAQSVTAYEGRAEVFRAPISSGVNYFGEDGVTLLNGTPGGAHNIWQKRISRHMQGGTLDAGYDVPGVGWVCYFASNGAALHSTYWHNDFGIPKSHGCLNCRPDDAKWLFRWTAPRVDYMPGDLTVNWANRGSIVDIRLKA